MNFWPNVLGKRADGARRAPSHLFGGRVRTSTVVLIVAFLAVWWTYDTYRPEPAPARPAQVVPPGFVPDPDYTWVPRDRVQPPGTTTVRPTPTTTAPTTTEPTTQPPTTTATTTTAPWSPPCLLPPPFCPATTTPTTPEPSPPPGPGPPPSSTPPAR